jgi:hypothetical protein
MTDFETELYAVWSKEAMRLAHLPKDDTEAMIKCLTATTNVLAGACGLFSGGNVKLARELANDAAKMLPAMAADKARKLVEAGR